MQGAVRGTVALVGGNVVFYAGGEPNDRLFSYTVSDGNGGTSHAVTTINVAAVNDAPVGAGQAPSRSPKMQPSSTARSSRPPMQTPAATFTFALNGAVPAGLTFNADGSYSFNPANAAYQSLAGVGSKPSSPCPTR